MNSKLIIKMSVKMSDSDHDTIFIREEHHVKVSISKVDLTLLQDEDVNVTHIVKQKCQQSQTLLVSIFLYIIMIRRHLCLKIFGLLLKTYTWKCIHVHFC